MAAESEHRPAPAKSAAARMALAAQVFLIRRNIAGPLGDFCMAIEHRGRKTGKAYSTPIAYLRDGADIIALSRRAGNGNWFKNTLAHAGAEIIIKGQTRSVKAREITDPVEIQRVFELYKTTFKAFERTFGVPLSADSATLEKARDSFRYLRLS